jgi:hypothetical protein
VGTRSACYCHQDHNVGIDLFGFGLNEIGHLSFEYRRDGPDRTDNPRASAAA